MVDPGGLRAEGRRVAGLGCGHAYAISNPQVWTQTTNGYGGWEIFDGHLAGPLTGVIGADGEPQIVARYCDGTTWYRTPAEGWSRIDALQQT